MLSTEEGSQVVVISGGWRNGHQQIRCAGRELAFPRQSLQRQLARCFVTLWAKRPP